MFYFLKLFFILLYKKYIKMNFRLNYDDNGIDIIEKISGKLAEFDLIIKNVDEGDGWIDYNIQKIEKIE